MRMIKILLFLLLGVVIQAWGQESSLANINVHEASLEELTDLYKNPFYGRPRFYPNRSEVSWAPAPDTSDFGYVLLSSEANFTEAANLRYIIAQNLPADVKLVLLVSKYDVNRIKQIYSQYISLDRVIFATSDSIANGFWARDAFPYPVVNANGDLSLVSANYYRRFRAGQDVANSVKLSMDKHNFTFVGGNLLADEQGNCFSIKSSRLFDTTEEDLQRAYGCRRVHFLKHLRGIGDVDEVIKPLGNGLMLSNTPEYDSVLTALGYKVIRLPSIPDSYRTYANSLIVGVTVFMPTYGISTDQEAKSVYEKLGYKVVGIPSRQLSDSYHGSIHCQTMAYPRMSEARLLEFLHLEKIN